MKGKFNAFGQIFPKLNSWPVYCSRQEDLSKIYAFCKWTQVSILYEINSSVEHMYTSNSVGSLFSKAYTRKFLISPYKVKSVFFWHSFKTCLSFPFTINSLENERFQQLNSSQRTRSRQGGKSHMKGKRNIFLICLKFRWL